jgi:DNA-binding NarL/FixJ family response regulator
MNEFKQFLQNSEADLVGHYMHSTMSIAEIAEQGGISKTKVYRILEKNGIVPNRLNKRHGHVQNMLQLGVPNDEIAQAANYSERHIRNIKRRMMED